MQSFSSWVSMWSEKSLDWMTEEGAISIRARYKIVTDLTPVDRASCFMGGLDFYA